MKKHVFAHHLPVYLNPQMICWICKKYVGSFDCLQHFHLKDHTLKDDHKFTEDKLQQYYSHSKLLLHELSKKITGKEDPRELSALCDQRIRTLSITRSTTGAFHHL